MRWGSLLDSSLPRDSIMLGKTLKSLLTGRSPPFCEGLSLSGDVPVAADGMDKGLEAMATALFS